jgi:hypothetical protein
MKLSPRAARPTWLTRLISICAAATGFGGTAPRPGASLLPWPGATPAAILAAAGGVLRLRRRRHPALHVR